MPTLIALICALALFTGAHTHADGIPRQSGFVEVPGGPVWYEIMGDGEDTPLLLLHGGPGGHSCGAQYMAQLGDERPVIRYDQLGSGRSGWPKDSSLWQRDRFVAELDAVRNALGLDEVHILGHSWGASLAAYYFLETGGEGVQSLILSSPLISTPRWIADTNLLRQQLPNDIQATLTEHELASTTDSDAYRKASQAFYDLFVTRGEAVEKYDCAGVRFNAVIYEQMWGPTEFHATGSLSDFDLTPRLKEIDIPTLFVTGEFDEARPETVAEFAAAVPGARFEEIPGVAHASGSRAPVYFRRLIRDFIGGIESP
ncbi:MAG: proline iminopeptidase-family hydrolase [Pseudomonadota bacterium]